MKKNLKRGEIRDVHGIWGNSTWYPPPETLSLNIDEVHVWRADLDLLRSRAQIYQGLLSDDERLRAGRFYFRKDRDQFVLTRGLLRLILCRYLNREPGKLAFFYGTYGRPEIVQGNKGENLCFNVSRSDGISLFAVTRGRKIGIDVEHMRSDISIAQISERFFSREEASALQLLPPHVREKAFFSCWTRKEAFIKATGKGLASPLNQFQVTLSPDTPPQLISIQGDSRKATRWSITDLDVNYGCAAAIAVEGDNWQLRLWEFREQDFNLKRDKGNRKRYTL